MLPAITQTIKEKYDLSFGPYGDYNLRDEGWPVKNFYTYNHHPRYLVNQFSLRNRMAILSEAFSHERFYDRIFSTYSFVTEILNYVHGHGQEMMDVNKMAEANVILLVKQQAGKVKKGVRFKMVPLQKIDLTTYDYLPSQKEDGTKTYLRTSKKIILKDVEYHAKFIAEVESTLPRGYIIPKEFSNIVDNLRKHGVVVTELGRSQKFSGEVFTVDMYEKASRKFEGHFMARATGKFVIAKRSFGKGYFVVDLAQPLGNLAFYFLEPESDDSYVTWNFFDAYFVKLGATNKPIEYPVFKFY